MGNCATCSEEQPLNLKAVDASHFTLLKVVGKGGFGKVNAVQDRISKHLYAMKRLSKWKVSQKEAYIQTTLRERDVMAKFTSPFLVNLLHAFQDETTLYLIMPFMQGGDLRYYLTTQGRMDEATLRFYAAELLLGLEQLHSLNIVYRDLKPDNVLFDADGHLRISDFGLCVILEEKDRFLTSGSAGTTGYQAPEVLIHAKYSFSADFWSYGVTLYELVEKTRPFHSTEEVLLNDRIDFRSQVTEDCKNFIRGLLAKDPKKRLGSDNNGIEGVKHHPFFASIEWDAMAARKCNAPHHPETDRANCLADFELEDQFFGDVKESELGANQQKRFAAFDFRTEWPMKPEPAPKPLSAVGDSNELGNTTEAKPTISKVGFDNAVTKFSNAEPLSKIDFCDAKRIPEALCEPRVTQVQEVMLSVSDSKVTSHSHASRSSSASDTDQFDHSLRRQRRVSA